jgi:hypothetical protein
MTKTDIRTLRRILALLQAADPAAPFARVLVTRLLRKHDASWQAMDRKRDNRERW